MDTSPLLEIDGHRLYYTFIAGAKKVLEHQYQLNKINVFPVNDGDTGSNMANAFVLFIEGIIDFIHSNSIIKLIRSKTETLILPTNNDQISQEVNFRYCTEGILKNLSINQQSLCLILQQHGDSIVIGGTEHTKHIHVHSNDPAELFRHLMNVSLITFQKADDMLRQSETIFKRKWNIALVTDSTCDLPQELFDLYQINMLPLNINFGESHYLDKVTIQPEQFYTLLNQHSEFPKTSQVNEKAFTRLYTQLCAHYDSVIAIHLTDKFSGTYYNSLKAAQAVNTKLNKPITVINSKNLSGALGLITLRTAQAIEAGHTHDEIVAMTEKWIQDTRIFVSVKTLKYMVRGGRVSFIKSFIAKMLNINPIVSMDNEGDSFIFGKTYHQRSNMEKVMTHIHSIGEGREIWNYIVLHAHNPEAAAWYAHKMKEFTGKEPVAVVDISPVIGANAGIGTASVALMFK